MNEFDERLAGIEVMSEFDERLAGIEAQLTEIRETLEFVKATIVKADSTITTVAQQVMPTIENLMKSPMLKMLGVGK